MKILFRADSSSQIGLGHIMRDLVLARQFSDDEVMFACQDLEGNIMDKIPYPVIVLLSMDVDALIMIVKQERVDMLVIDHYGISYEDEKKIKEATGVKIFVLDDTYEKHFCDVLLNHNISADEYRYHDRVPTGCELRCGSQYTLIRDEFKKVKVLPKKKNVNTTVFVAMGGSDHSHKNIEILKVLEDFPNLHIHIVTSKSNQYLTELKKYVENRVDINLHIDSDSIASLMHESDFAIVTPSVTVHEVMYMDLPFIAIKTAENQHEMYAYLDRHNYTAMQVFDAEALKYITQLSHMQKPGLTP